MTDAARFFVIPRNEESQGGINKRCFLAPVPITTRHSDRGTSEVIYHSIV